MCEKREICVVFCGGSGRSRGGGSLVKVGGGVSVRVGDVGRRRSVVGVVRGGRERRKQGRGTGDWGRGRERRREQGRGYGEVVVFGG